MVSCPIATPPYSLAPCTYGLTRPSAPFSVHLSLGGNRLTGSINEVLGNLDMLQTLDLSQNQLSGSIPRSLFDLEFIQEIHFHSNMLDGVIPSSFGVSTTLQRLELHGNVLTGMIPDVESFAALEELTLQDNGLTGTMPRSICELRLDGFGILNTLTADCDAAANPRVSCATACCTSCFPDGSTQLRSSDGLWESVYDVESEDSYDGAFDH